MDEIWKDIKNHEGLYQVSNMGRVKSLRTGKLIKPFLNGNGYLRVRLCKNKVGKHIAIHRLVAETFIPNPYNLEQVNHINENKTDNRVENLEWSSRQYNIDYSLSKPVYQYSTTGELVREWCSTMAAQREGYDNRHISACCLGKQHTHKGYIWKYKEEQP